MRGGRGTPSGWFWNRARSYVTSFGAKCETSHLSRPVKPTYSPCTCNSERHVRRYEASEHYYEHSNGVKSRPNAIMSDPNALPGIPNALPSAVCTLPKHRNTVMSYPCTLPNALSTLPMNRNVLIYGRAYRYDARSTPGLEQMKRQTKMFRDWLRRCAQAPPVPPV